MYGFLFRMVLEKKKKMEGWIRRDRKTDARKTSAEKQNTNSAPLRAYRLVDHKKALLATKPLDGVTLKGALW